MNQDDLREQVRRRYADAAQSVAEGRRGTANASAECCGGPGDAEAFAGTEAADSWCGSNLYKSVDATDLPIGALEASLGCGTPTAMAELHAGERVLDLGSGGGIDVLLSAERVGPSGFVYGVDMTREMVDLARTNAREARVSNVEFLEGAIEQIPLPDAAVDVVISNCVINLSTDKAAVLAEMFRVLTPGGRIGVSDVVAADQLSEAERAERGTYVGCIAGALSRGEYLSGLAAAGFVDPSVEFTREVADGMHAATIRATKPAD